MSARESTTEATKRSPAPLAMAERLRRWHVVLFLAALLTLILALAPHAEAYVYWADFDSGTIGRANLDGTSADQRFITRTGDRNQPGGVFLNGVAVDAGHIYWSDENGGTIGRANLDGTGVDKRFITGLGSPGALAVDAAHLYWTNNRVADFGTSTIGRANLDGTGVDHSFIPGLESPSGVAVDAAHVYWSHFVPPEGSAIGRANLDGTGVDRRFITAGPFNPVGLAVDAAHVYWADGNTTIGRANLDGTGADPSFIADAGEAPVGVAVDAAHVYWANVGMLLDSVRNGTIGRANLDGTGADNRFITGADDSTRSRSAGPTGVAVDALRSFSFGKVKRNKKRGTAKLTVVVPGPGKLRLAQTKQVKRAKKRADAEGSVKLPVKSRGTARKKLSRKGKAKVKSEVAYAPTDGDPTIVANSDTKTVKLIKR
jgi:virginiamycin B lyase